MSEKSKPQSLYTTPKQLFIDLLFIISGSVLYAIVINGILIPHNFVNGGITGVSLIVHKNFPSINVGLIYLIINIPIFALGWMSVGRRFFFYSVLGALALSISAAYIHIRIPLEDRMLSALMAGVIGGAGSGITLRSSGSQGGLDILAVLLLKRFSIGIGDTTLAMNGFILLLTGIFYSLEAVLYTMIVLFVSSRILNLVVSGLSHRKAVFIISKKWREISKEILKDVQKGVTVINGEGGYSGVEKKILYVVITFRDIGELKKLILKNDPDAFVVVTDTIEVMNYRIGNQPHW